MRIRAAVAVGAILLGFLGSSAAAHEKPSRDPKDYSERYKDYSKDFEDIAKKIKAMCPEGDMIILPLSVMTFHVTICLPSGEVRM